MGSRKFKALPCLPIRPIVGKTVASNVSTFKQHYEESLKDAWFRLNKIHSEDSDPCEKEKLHLYYYYGLELWYKKALDFASGGSFVLSPP